MVREKRKLFVAVAAAISLSGCAPAGYSAAAYGNAAPAAGATTDPAPAAAPAKAAASPVATSDPGKTVSDDAVTTSLTGTKVAKMGSVIEDQNGFVLYRFDGDTSNPAKTTCDATCAKVWHPALTNDGKPTLNGVDDGAVGTVVRADGTRQLTVHGWPLYHYIGDKKAGTWKGQNVLGKWFVIKPDGTKNLTCVPPVSKPVAPPSADSAGSTSNYSY